MWSAVHCEVLLSKGQQVGVLKIDGYKVRGASAKSEGSRMDVNVNSLDRTEVTMRVARHCCVKKHQQENILSFKRFDKGLELVWSTSILHRRSVDVALRMSSHPCKIEMFSEALTLRYKGHVEQGIADRKIKVDLTFSSER